MVRRFVLISLAIVLAAGLIGCGSEAEDSTADEETSASSAGVSTASLPDGMDAIPITGPAESAVAESLPAALESATKMLEDSGQTVPDLAGAEPRLTAYLISVTMGDQTALFEVRADGEPHNIYAYQRPFDSGTIVWTPAEMSQAPASEPKSDPEKAAVAAVEAAMKADFDDPLTVAVYGYRFVYVRGESALFSLEVGTDGAVISASSTPS